MPTEDEKRLLRSYMPPEWAPHEATWLSWPHNPDTWPGVLPQAEAAMVEVAAALAPHEHVHVNVLSREHRDHVTKLLAPRLPSGSFTCHPIVTDDAWIRDHGAIFAFTEDGELCALDFGYNAWGGKYPPWDNDARAASRMAAELNVAVRNIDIVLEGGSVDVNGNGAVLTTEQCLLNQNRNPALSREEIEAHLQQNLGAQQIIWLGEGIVGDDTDGHIDDITRFVDERTIVTAVEADRNDANFDALAANRRQLETLSLGGQGCTVIELPMPEPLLADGERLPASYANFYIANGVVLLPVFRSSADEAAAEILSVCLPGREVVPIDARALVHGLGGIHCLTQQVPAADALLSCPQVLPKVTGSV